MVGDDVILPCHLEPAEDAVSMTVEWARLDLNPRFVHVRHDSAEFLTDQNPSYTGRTSMSITKLKHGDVSLKLSNVRLSDEGIYKCYIPRQKKKVAVKLAVGVASAPGISLAGIHEVSSGVMLDCRSKGWYPEPELFWLDGEGNLLSAGPTETVRGPDDLYTVSRRLTVRKSDSFTCRVQQKNINQTRETHFYVPGDETHMKEREIPITSSKDIELQCLNEGRGDRQVMGRQGGEEDLTSEPSTEFLNEEIHKLYEELKKNKDDYEDVKKTLDVLTKYKKNLVDYSEELKLLSSWIDKQIINNKLKLDASWRQWYIDKYEAIVRDLKQRKEVNETLLQKTKEVVQRTEDQISQTTEKKRELEEQIKCLEEIKERPL
ncbi:Butyrophilin-like protein 1 [Nibea albiflora]|uniref:Butyrophilin-like protein 1 n=1 Tax=Nibea albiflora TaxID=240163 RepID=A0ACB7EUF3_NIBAL|nr:Butyrophilin-like protein 1 [Nibea albiflora]